VIVMCGSNVWWIGDRRRRFMMQERGATLKDCKWSLKSRSHGIYMISQHLDTLAQERG
jgi:hypothetical protein